MKKIKQFLGIMLSLVMVVGLMPGMSMTALADDPYESIMNELKMFMSGFDIDPRIYGMVEEFRNLEE